MIGHFRFLTVQWSGAEEGAGERGWVRSRRYVELRAVVMEMSENFSNSVWESEELFVGERYSAKWWRQRNGQDRIVRFMQESCSD